MPCAALASPLDDTCILSMPSQKPPGPAHSVSLALLGLMGRGNPTLHCHLLAGCVQHTLLSELPDGRLRCAGAACLTALLCRPAVEQVHGAWTSVPGSQQRLWHMYQLYLTWPARKRTGRRDALAWAAC